MTTDEAGRLRIKELEEERDRYKRESDHLRRACKELSETTWSGEYCSSCKLPTADTEHVVNFGLCDRCVNTMLDKDRWKERWKELRRRIEEERKPFRYNPDTLTPEVEGKGEIPNYIYANEAFESVIRIINTMEKES